MHAQATAKVDTIADIVVGHAPILEDKLNNYLLSKRKVDKIFDQPSGVRCNIHPFALCRLDGGFSVFSVVHPCCWSHALSAVLSTSPMSRLLSETHDFPLGYQRVKDFLADLAQKAKDPEATLLGDDHPQNLQPLRSGIRGLAG
jgi:hypothetical protein